jgi:hypothetical protein
MENQYNLPRRQDERELLPMCAGMGALEEPYTLHRPSWFQHPRPRRNCAP